MAQKKAPPTLTKPWRSVTDLRATLTRARELHSEASKRLDEMNVRVAKRREELRANLHDLSPAQQSLILNRALGGLRADLKRDSADARTARLREIDALRRQAEDASAHYHSPMQMLMRDSLGSERRSRLIQQFETGRRVDRVGLALRARDRAALHAGEIQDTEEE